ncbi:MAG: PAS domain-containing protein [Nitrospirae bacterium]|nr:PAS domain-containing protein [Nitrospirota bacterium]
MVKPLLDTSDGAVARESPLWFTRLRWGAVGGLVLMLSVGGHVLGILDAAALPYLWMLVAGLAAGNVVFRARAGRVERPGREVLIQVLFDLVVLTGLLALSGGSLNPFAFVYAFHVVMAGILLPGGWAYRIAGLSSVLFVGLGAVGVAGWLPQFALRFGGPDSIPLAEEISRLQSALGGSLHYQLSTAAAFITSMFVLAFFTTTLAGRLREHRRKAEVLAATLSSKADELGLAEAQVREEKAKLLATYQSMSDGVILLDRENRIVFSNAAAEAFRRPGRHVGRPVLACHPEMAHGRVQAELESLRKGRRTSFHRLVSAGDRTFEATYTSVRDAADQHLGIVIVSRDITDRLEMEKRMAHQERLSSLARVAAGLAHEVGNPLSSLMARLRLLEEEKDDPATVEESLVVLKRELMRISRIVRDMSDFSRPAQGEPGSCLVGTVVRDVLRLVEPDARERGVHLECDLDGELPAVPAHPDHLRQIFLNLLINALDATPAGGRIDVAGGRRDSKVWVAFRDTGHGVPSELLPRIFEPFFTTKTERKGTGLGLWVSYSLARAQGGTIEISSEPGAGSTFTVLLALQPPLSEPAQVEP